MILNSHTQLVGVNCCAQHYQNSTPHKSYAPKQSRKCLKLFLRRLRSELCFRFEALKSLFFNSVTLLLTEKRNYQNLNNNLMLKKNKRKAKITQN